MTLVEELRRQAEQAGKYSAGTQQAAVLTTAHELAATAVKAAEELEGMYVAEVDREAFEQRVERVVSAAARLARAEADMRDTQDAEDALERAKNALVDILERYERENEKWKPRQEKWREKLEKLEQRATTRETRIRDLEAELAATKDELANVRKRARQATEILETLGLPDGDVS